MFTPTGSEIIVPLQAIPSQQLNTQLGGQAITLKVYQKDDEIFCDLWNDSVLIWAGIVCLTDREIKPAKFMNFNGQLIFRDLIGDENPDFEGFGSRWILQYVQD